MLHKFCKNQYFGWKFVSLSKLCIIKLYCYYSGLFFKVQYLAHLGETLSEPGKVKRSKSYLRGNISPPMMLHLQNADRTKVFGLWMERWFVRFRVRLSKGHRDDNQTSLETERCPPAGQMPLFYKCSHDYSTQVKKKMTPGFFPILRCSLTQLVMRTPFVLASVREALGVCHDD